MKIKEIAIDKYKNLEGTFSFEQNNGYIALIGLNGSGKSNLLEAISAIFNELSGRKNRSDMEDIDNYQIKFEVRGHDVSAKKNDSLSSDNLPSNIITCYSGEDTRLWEDCYKNYYVDFFNDAVKKDGEYRPKSLYINRYCWKIAFVTLLYSDDSSVKSFLEEKMKIDISSVQIKFKKKGGRDISHDAINWYKRIMSVYGENYFSIEQLKEVELDSKKYGKELNNDAIVFYYLYLLSMPEKNSKIGMNVDKRIEDIDIEVNGYSFDGLSEGEKKLILIECITKILGDENSLVLLDEPDAHTHIAMKKDLLKLISEFKGQTIMTTHSPMFLNKRWEGYDENNIFYLHEGIIENTEPLKHLAELTDNEIDYFKGSFILSSKKILVVEGKYDDQYLRKAIEVLSRTDAKYKKLNEIVIFSANGASEAEVIYKQSLKPSINRIEKLVFLFDYDDSGWKEGWKKIKSISDSTPKITPLFYQHDYSSSIYPTEDTDVMAANNRKKEISKNNAFMVEDIFSADAYSDVIRPVISSRTHKDFNCLTIGKKGTVGAIKEYIEKHYEGFDDSYFNGFEPVLGKLIEVFDL